MRARVHSSDSLVVISDLDLFVKAVVNFVGLLGSLGILVDNHIVPAIHKLPGHFRNRESIKLVGFPQVSIDIEEIRVLEVHSGSDFFWSSCQWLTWDGKEDRVHSSDSLVVISDLDLFVKAVVNFVGLLGSLGILVDNHIVPAIHKLPGHFRNRESIKLVGFPQVSIDIEEIRVLEVHSGSDFFWSSNLYSFLLRCCLSLLLSLRCIFCIVDLFFCLFCFR